jgi:death-on-curing protein
LENSLPANAVKFLSLDELLVIHERLIERFGGAPGVRDKGMLESALFRPQTGYYGSLEEMATAFFESLLINHPFADGNKRVAFFATDVFLRLNGWNIQVDSQAAFTFLMERLETGTADFDHLLPWIRTNLRPT